MKIYSDIDEMEKASADLGRVIADLEGTICSLESVLHDMQVTWQGDTGREYVFRLRSKVKSLKSSASSVSRMKKTVDERIRKAQEIDKSCRQVVETVSEIISKLGEKRG